MQDVLTNSISVNDLIALYRGAESRAARLRLLIGAGRDLAMADRIETASSVVLRAAAEFGAYDAGCLLLLDPDCRSVRVVATLGDGFPAIGTALPVRDSIETGDPCGAALLDHVRASATPAFAAQLETGWMLPFGGGDVDAGTLVLVAHDAVPVLGAEDRDTLQLLVSMLAGVASVARHRLEQARLNRMLEQREARLAELVARLISAQEDERRRLSIELHDGIAQLTSGALQYLQACAPTRTTDDEAAILFQRSLDLLRRVTAEIRSIMANLRPAVLDDFGIATALRKELEEHVQDGVRTTFADSLRGMRLPADVETTIFRVCQEALRNAHRHARATRIDVELAIEGVRLVARIRDDGVGFDTDPGADPEADPDTCTDRGSRPDANPGSGPGSRSGTGTGARMRGERLGMLGMAERMRQIGGQFRVVSRPGGGTLVEVLVPLPVVATETPP